MGCCGKNKLATKANGKGASAPQNLQPGQDGMVLIEYQGLDAGTSSWWGEATGQRYVFGGTRKRGLVDVQDAPGFLALYEGPRKLFNRVQAEPQKSFTRQAITSKSVVPAINGTAVDEDDPPAVSDLVIDDELGTEPETDEGTAVDDPPVNIRQAVIDKILAMNVEKGRNAMIDEELTEAELLALKEGELAKEQPRVSITRHADKLIADIHGQQAMLEVA